MLRPARCNHVKRAVASETKLRQRPSKTWSAVGGRPAIGYRPEAGHVAVRGCGASGMMAHNASDSGHIANSTVLPARLASDFQASIQQDFGQPCQRERHYAV